VVVLVVRQVVRRLVALVQILYFQPTLLLAVVLAVVLQTFLVVVAVLAVVQCVAPLVLEALAILRQHPRLKVIMALLDMPLVEIMVVAVEAVQAQQEMLA